MFAQNINSIPHSIFFYLSDDALPNPIEMGWFGGAGADAQIGSLVPPSFSTRTSHEKL
jgi:hypothetical protein